MRKMFVKYMSALLVVWYSLSIIGFDVHSCRATGEVFLASLAGGIACEDVHPEHSCKAHGSCCEQKVSSCCSHDVHSCCGHEAEPCCGHEDHHAGSQMGKPDCCSNDLQVLQLTGVQMSDNERFGANVRDCQLIFDVDLTMELAMPALQKSFIKYLEHPDPGVVMPDRQAFLSIWRV